MYAGRRAPVIAYGRIRKLRIKVFSPLIMGKILVFFLSFGAAIARCVYERRSGRFRLFTRGLRVYLFVQPKCLVKRVWTRALTVLTPRLTRWRLPDTSNRNDKTSPSSAQPPTQIERHNSRTRFS